MAPRSWKEIFGVSYCCAKRCAASCVPTMRQGYLLRRSKYSIILPATPRSRFAFTMTDCLHSNQTLPEWMERLPVWWALCLPRWRRAPGSSSKPVAMTGARRRSTIPPRIVQGRGVRWQGAGVVLRRVPIDTGARRTRRGDEEREQVGKLGQTSTDFEVKDD